MSLEPAGKSLGSGSLSGSSVENEHLNPLEPLLPSPPDKGANPLWQMMAIKMK